ncbi:oxidoreductase [soil metagenome]
MTDASRTGGVFTPAGTDLAFKRMGYGAMQLPGPHVWGPPKNEAAALAVLREALALGVNHIDTADFYGPHVSNRLIKEALSPYPDDLILVTKVGFERGDDSSWRVAQSKKQLTRAVHDNLRNLGLERLDVVNLRLGGPQGPVERSLAEPLGILAGLQKEGLIRHLGLSTITPAQFEEAKLIAPICCVQNHYNLAHRADDAFIDSLAQAGVAYVPYFPLGGFTPLQSTALDEAAKAVGVTPMQTALAWLLQRSPNILLIPGTSSVEHLRQNMAAAQIELPPDVVAGLDRVGAVEPLA